MNDLTKGNPVKLIIQFAVPIFIGNIFQLFYSLGDTMIIGNTLTQDALAAVGSVSTLSNLMIGFLIGLTNGFAILCANHFGAKKMDLLKKDIGGILKLGTIIAILLTFVTLVFLNPLLDLLKVPQGITRQYASSYIKIILWGMTAGMLYNACAGVLRAIGDSITPLLFLIFSTLCNLFLDYLFIVPFGMGVEGAALATVISQVLAAVMCYVYMYKKYPALRICAQDLQVSVPLAKQLLKSGLSMAFMNCFVGLGTLALQTSINGLGNAVIVAHTGARKITELFMLPFAVFGMTMATYCSQNLGAGKTDRIKKGIVSVLVAGSVWCIVTLIMSYTCVPAMMKLITGSDVQEVLDTATLYLKIDSIFYFVTLNIAVLRNALQGLGNYMTTIFSSFIELVGKVLVVLLLVPKMGYMGVIVAEPLVWVVMVIPLLYKILTTPVLKTKSAK